MTCDDEHVGLRYVVSSPSRFAGSISFRGRVRRATIGAFATKQGIRFAIMPSRYETFYLAAHEAALFGHLVVLPRLPAYKGYYVDGHANTFICNSVDDLARVMKHVILDNSAVERIAKKSPSITYPDAAEGYRRMLDA